MLLCEYEEDIDDESEFEMGNSSDLIIFGNENLIKGEDVDFEKESSYMVQANSLVDDFDNFYLSFYQ